MQSASSPKDTEYEKEDGNEVSFWAHAMQCNAYESFYEGESTIPTQYLKRALELILQENSF